MWVARKSTQLDSFAGYYMSLNKMELAQYEAYTEPNHTFYSDWKLRDDILLVRKEVFEQTFGLKLESLEQIEI